MGAASELLLSFGGVDRTLESLEGEDPCLYSWQEQRRQVGGDPLEVGQERGRSPRKEGGVAGSGR